MPRLIDADALREKLIALNYHTRAENMNEACVRTVDDAPTVGDCISVKDRLPDGEDCYLAYNRYGWDIMAYDPNEGVWLSMGHRVADGEITHWMPLPAEPPEEVSMDD